jgi:hypothetical protein
VDSSNLPIRIVTNMFLSATATTAPEQVTTTTNYTNWGERVSITPPPADQITTIGGN